ncbi:MAG: hypothetical protein CMB80_21205 [Flammeovirgaceae bacterium]|nr:hypothetical protein [Flammeovirgaceae bacterium]MBE61704.1 hypothetical protein [Flammeovirgaceae bacterium]HCX20971.1 hypothetical protein [Cytophagales bacterium]|tara:strand:- start:2710 stop:3030 length:321 start_codon:yes stop_codon:yes gene_type:complete
MSEARIVIVGYRPLVGKEQALEALMKSHVSRLRDEGLSTSRPSIIVKSSNGTIVEVFEWKSQAAIELAHTNAEVQKMWQEFAEVCEYVPVGELPEMGELFSEFIPL